MARCSQAASRRSWIVYEEDLSYSEIAQELGISRTAVMDAVHKSVQLLEKIRKKTSNFYNSKQKSIL